MSTKFWSFSINQSQNNRLTLLLSCHFPTKNPTEYPLPSESNRFLYHHFYLSTSNLTYPSLRPKILFSPRSTPSLLRQNRDFSLALPPPICYKSYLISAMNGKIIVNAAQRGPATGCKPDCGGTVWFAREPPWRHGRTPTVTGVSKCAPFWCEFGWYRGRDRAFRPKNWDGGYFFILFPQL